MNKKIVMSLSVIAAAAAVVMGGTSAFFSDTEISTGNTFTAGAIDLKVSNHSYYNGLEMPNLSWSSKDLETGNLFFNFADLKPGDLGEDTIDLTVNNNDAYACMDIDVTGTPENGINEPEADDDTTPGTDEGELQDELHMTFWADDGDNVLELDEESTIFVNNKTIQEISDGGTVTLADSVSNVWSGTGAMTGATTYYIGKVFCFGNLTQAPVATDAGENPSVASGFTCSGATVTNASQTDGVTGNVSFTAIQSRNNGDFKCSISNTQTAYNSIPDSLAGNYPSQPFQAQQTSEFGDYIHLGGTARDLSNVTVTMSTWARFSEYPSMSAGGWNHPITLNIYSSHLGTNGAPDTLLATKTQNIDIPWRPEGDPTCPDTGYGAGFAWKASDDTCYNGLAFNATFDLSSLNVTLPDDVIIGIVYNTQTYGPSPIGANGPYNSLNVAVPSSDPVTVGSDDSASEVFWNTLTAAWYADHGAAGVGIFRKDTNWSPYGTVALKVEAN